MPTIKGGGEKRMFRIIDWKRDKTGVPAKVATIEYDPNRSARIALLNYADGEKRYMVVPDGLQGRRHGDLRAGCGGRRSATRCRSGICHSAPKCTTSSCARARARRRCARPGPRPDAGERRRLRHPAHALGRNAPGFGDLHGHGWRRSGIRTTETSSSARLGAHASAASARPCAAPRCLRGTIRTEVAKAAPRSERRAAHTVGQEGAGCQDPPQQTHQSFDRAPPREEGQKHSVELRCLHTQVDI